MILKETDLITILNKYGIESYKEYRGIESSRDNNDIRENYIIDNLYVLRLNSIDYINEERANEINELVVKCKDIGLLAPKYIKDNSGKYINKYKGYTLYITEYLNYPIADKLNETELDELIDHRIQFISEFAQKYKNIDISNSYSMYSLFDLSYYDKKIGKDEKKQNCDELVCFLRKIELNKLADKLEQENENIRSELLKIHKELPRCTFQGDENFSNICVSNGKIVGLFDFNLYGSEVIANYLANIAFQGKFRLTDEFINLETRKLADLIINDFKQSTSLMEKYYRFNPKEKRAYYQYSKLVLLFGFVNIKAFIYYLKGEHKDKLIELLTIFSSVNLEKA